MSDVKVIRLPRGDSSLDHRNIEGSNKEEDFIALVVSGVDDPDELAKKLDVGVLTVRRALRDTQLMGKIKQAIRARALTMIPKTLERAYMDTDAKRASTRSMAREYIRKIAEGEASVIQQNNSVTSWDPTYDEQLFERGRVMFQSLAEVTAKATVRKMMEDEKDEGEDD